ncbi:hypothetical protein EYZ11_009205 [Aspergillus tanneri]|uniref:Uncharacterized protein n=1 Tax=Aspergillus tanneri TaxID=1220188 RepID=A0A4S3J8P8_9EURO|nr:hypothetical protein EYZ11_009205 [Aspergillus tanneri]
MAVLFTPEPIEGIASAHIETHYNTESCQWSVPALLVDADAQIQDPGPALNYDQQDFDGVKVYRNPNGEIHIFRPDFHATCFQQSCIAHSIDPMSQEHFIRCVELAVSRNAEYVPPHESEALLYIQPIRRANESHNMLGNRPSHSFIFCAHLIPESISNDSQPLTALVVDELDKATPRERSYHQAAVTGYDLALYFDSETHTVIKGFSSAAFIGIMGGGENKPVRVIGSDSCRDRQNVTRESCMAIAQSLGWITEKQRVSNPRVRILDYESLPDD